MIDKKFCNHESFLSKILKLMEHGRSKKDGGIGVDKPDTIGDMEKFKGLHRKINLCRLLFLSFVIGI